MLVLGGDVRKSKAIFGNEARFFNRANYQGMANSQPMG
jgi:hypothetical protein